LGEKLKIDQERVDVFCRKWKVAELSIFGSILREDFGPDSDVDVMVSLEPGAPWSLFEWVDMIDELEEIFGRKVDLVEKSGLRNPFRRHEIFSSAKVLYAA
jgi:predicted nucleotidyltransferase